ncbi:uncharacterized protein LOC143208196 isoform X3 [Lasioglossum baleicum]|uniref:uncharacterized protein LOC143208196 isoform X3 n=1 Tax=Lasioglossum baleicum TaxID=434251 RepID=UPI003FCEA860
MIYDGSHRDFLQTRSHRCGNYHCYGENKVGGSASDGLLVRSWADGLRRRYGGEGVVRAKGCAPSTVSKTHSPRSEENRRIEGIAVSKASLSIGKSQCEGNSKRRKREKESGL